MKKWLVVILGALAACAALIVVGGPLLFHRVVDNLLSDVEEESLVTAVSLIELHRLRTGRYPDTLDDLEFLGTWDNISVGGVDYAPADDRSAYFVEIPARGGRPARTMPEAFWHGTGYRAELRQAERPPRKSRSMQAVPSEQGQPGF